MAEKILLALSTFPDAETARKISNQLVAEKLAACANILPSVESIYRWKEKRKRNTRVFQAERGWTISVPGEIALIASLRGSRNHFRSGFERTVRIFGLGCRKLRSGALTFLAKEVNCDADRVRDSGYGDDLHSKA